MEITFLATLMAHHVVSHIKALLSCYQVHCNHQSIVFLGLSYQLYKLVIQSSCWCISIFCRCLMAKTDVRSIPRDGWSFPHSCEKNCPLMALVVSWKLYRPTKSWTCALAIFELALMINLYCYCTHLRHFQYVQLPCY